jgi:hypothetical protein
MWLRSQGYAVITTPESGRANLDGFQCVEAKEGANEFDTMSCGHCNRIVHVGARKRPEDIGGLCKQCMRCICPQCVDRGNCDPLERQLERMEAREEALRSYGI